MKIPLHSPYGAYDTPDTAAAKYNLWTSMMHANAKGFRQPHTSKKQGKGVKKGEGGVFPYLNGLILIMKHGERDVTG